MRKAGIGAINNKNLTANRFKYKKDDLKSSSLLALSDQVSEVRSALKNFATNHKDEIRKNREFRTHFHAMCATVGLDPLCYSRGQWSTLLGIGDFYYLLGIKVIEFCYVWQNLNGGLFLVADIVEYLNKNSDKESLVSTDDVLRAVKQLDCLGTAFSIIYSNSSNLPMIQSIPLELNLDYIHLIDLSESHNGCISLNDCTNKLSWSEERALQGLETLLKNGIAWLDQPNEQTKLYWITSHFRV
ncbi:ESCRT-II subunit protein snf8 [Cichlidogyrus casuarinus]|uniref:Vacuolar-sorting protein SNF8 n=1 Tax=Cichlidogyrus casuarinus TaxID=1844966 RepID=A0ABD2QRL8_9PLAT